MDNNDFTHEVIGAYYKVYTQLGYGFLERIYENALMIELTEIGLNCQRQHPIPVYYKEQIVGEYFADIVVEGKLILELKAADYIIEEYEYQLLNYLKATNIEVGLLLNFGKKPEFKRKIFSNYNK
jgi:GxxExxY protein